MQFPVVYLIQRPLSIFWVFQHLEDSLVVIHMQLILLQRMVPPSNRVPQNHTSFGIMGGVIGILCTALAKLQNYISILVNVYFTDFCTRVHKFLFDKVHFDLSSAYSIDP